MKCWECKRQVKRAAVFSYYVPKRGSVVRDVCQDCEPLMPQEGRRTRFVRVPSLRSRATTARTRHLDITA